MRTTPSASNADTWGPSWEQHPKLSHVLRPYSTAAAVSAGTRPQPELWDICNGCILWLPPKADIREILNTSLSHCASDLFDHPILVLKIETTGPRDATVHFAIMTSLGKRPLEDKNPIHQDRYLPIHPAKPHLNSGVLLRLENEKPKRGMVDNSYVSIGKVYSVGYRALRCYSAGQKADGYRHRLTKDSFDQVARELGYSSSAWIETGGLWEEFVRRHVPTGAEEASDLGA